MNSRDNGLVLKDVETDFRTASKRIKQAIKESPASLMTVFDHQTNANDVGMDMSPTKVFVFGNPELGTPILNEYRTLAIDLPQRMLLWEEEGQVKIAYNDPEYLFERHEVKEKEAKQKISNFLENIADSAEK